MKTLVDSQAVDSSVQDGGLPETPKIKSIGSLHTKTEDARVVEIDALSPTVSSPTSAIPAEKEHLLVRSIITHI